MNLQKNFQKNFFTKFYLVSTKFYQMLLSFTSFLLSFTKFYQVLPRLVLSFTKYPGRWGTQTMFVSTKFHPIPSDGVCSRMGFV